MVKWNIHSSFAVKEHLNFNIGNTAFPYILTSVCIDLFWHYFLFAYCVFKSLILYTTQIIIITLWVPSYGPRDTLYNKYLSRIQVRSIPACKFQLFIYTQKLISTEMLTVFRNVWLSNYNIQKRWILHLHCVNTEMQCLFRSKRSYWQV